MDITDFDQMEQEAADRLFDEITSEDENEEINWDDPLIADTLDE